MLPAVDKDIMIQWLPGAGYKRLTYVRAELEVACASDNVLVVRIVQVSVHYLFRQGKRALKPAEQ